MFLLWKNISIEDANIPPSSVINIDSAIGSIQVTVSKLSTEVSTTVLASFNSVVDITGNLEKELPTPFQASDPDWGSTNKY